MASKSEQSIVIANSLKQLDSPQLMVAVLLSFFANEIQALTKYRYNFFSKIAVPSWEEVQQPLSRVLSECLASAENHSGRNSITCDD